MAISLLKVMDSYDSPLYHEYVIDYDDDVQNLPGLSQCCVGSRATSIESSTHYILGSNGVWKVDLSFDPGSPGGTSNYNDLSNKPRINGVVLNGNKTTEDLGIESSPMAEITWSALKALRDNGNLIPGMQYRITDYETIITGSYDLSAFGLQGYMHNAGVPESHPFDIIVVADDESHLNENARAARHDRDYYFAPTISGWKLKYCLDNNRAAYKWANEDGKGVIWWMEDEFNNCAPFDFKNIRFLRYALKQADATPDYTPHDASLVYNPDNQPNRYGGFQQIYRALQSYMDSGTYVNPWLHTYHDGTAADYDFAVGGSILNVTRATVPDDDYLETFHADWYYTFDYYSPDVGHVDASLNGLPGLACRDNYFEIESDQAYASVFEDPTGRGLNGSVIETNSVMPGTPMIDMSRNHFGEFSWSNTLGSACCDNTFGNLCYGNTLGCACNGNTFRHSSHSNTLGDECEANIFGDDCHRNVICGNGRYNRMGNVCRNNFLGSLSSRIIFDNICQDNTIEDAVYDITFHNSCYRISIDANCVDIVLGNSCSSIDIAGPCTKIDFAGNNSTIHIPGGMSRLRVDWGVSSVFLTVDMTGRSNAAKTVQTYGPGGSATFFIRTAYDTEIVYTTTDGGSTWTLVNMNANGVSF